MTVQPSPKTDPAQGLPGCWCCGSERPEEGLVRLGERPEVGVCLGCIRFLHRRAKERSAGQIGRRLHGVAGRVRGAVTGAGLHEKPVIGGLLRRIDRYLPF